MAESASEKTVARRPWIVKFFRLSFVSILVLGIILRIAGGACVLISNVALALCAFLASYACLKMISGAREHGRSGIKSGIAVFLAILVAGFVWSWLSTPRLTYLDMPARGLAIVAFDGHHVVLETSMESEAGKPAYSLEIAPPITAEIVRNDAMKLSTSLLGTAEAKFQQTVIRYRVGRGIWVGKECFPLRDLDRYALILGRRVICISRSGRAEICP